MSRRIRVCQFCAEKNKRIDYKSVDVLRGLISDRGKIRPRRYRAGAETLYLQKRNEIILSRMNAVAVP